MNAMFDQDDRVRVRARSFFRPIFVGLAVSLFLVGVGFGVAGFFGANVVHVNRRDVHGPTALGVGTLIGVVSALSLAPLVSAMACLGLWIASWFRPLTIHVVRPDVHHPDFDDSGKPSIPTEG